MNLAAFWPKSAKVRAGYLILLFFVLLATFGPMLTPYDPQRTGVDILQPPSAAHPLGTTNTGQDVFAQFVYGARISMLVGFVAALFSKSFSVLIGLVGGYLRGRVDNALYILTAVFLVIPAMPLLIILTGYLPSRGLLTIATVIAVTSWAGSARVLRAQTLSLRSRDFIEAARATGESQWRIIMAEILPNQTPLIASGFLFMVVGGILAEAGLSFLGLGNLTTVSWGSMLYFAQSANALLFGAWWWFVPPGIAIATIGAGLALINFGIDEYANPRLRSAKNIAKRAAKQATASTIVEDFVPDPDSVLGQKAIRDAVYAQAPLVAHQPVQLPGSVLLEVRELNVNYPTDSGVVHAVRDVSLVLRRGEILGLAGESGSGKSTLTNAIARLLKAPAEVTSGEVLFTRADGTTINIQQLSASALRRFRWRELSVVFQSAMNALNPVITIFGQFDDTLRVHRPTMTQAERLELAQQMLVKVGIPADRVHHYPHELSGGMKQRVAIALSLLLNPDMIIMDEPTTALDLLIQREVLELILDLRAEFGFAVIFTTHDLSLLLELSDSIAVMRRGQIVEYGPAELVHHAPEHPYTRALLSSMSQLGARI